MLRGILKGIAFGIISGAAFIGMAGAIGVDSWVYLVVGVIGFVAGFLGAQILH